MEIGEQSSVEESRSHKQNNDKNERKNERRKEPFSVLAFHYLWRTHLENQDFGEKCNLALLESRAHVVAHVEALQ